MADKTWKKVEREACRELGGDRRGPTGRDTCDCDDRVKVGLEIKSYKRLVFLTKDWEQAVRNAEKIGLIPVLYVREGGRSGRKRVQMRDRDYWGLLGLSRNEHGFIRIPPVITYGDLLRMEWDDFVWLYRAAYIDNKETQTV